VLYWSMTMNELLALSGTAQGVMIENGTISSAELVEAHLERIAEVNPRLNAAVVVLADEARRAARESDRRRAGGARLGPLDGVPFSIKDSIDVAGCITTVGTTGFRNAPPARRDATLVARLREAGAIPLAKTNVPDLLFAYETDNLIHGRTHNPYDLARTPGGSSGGEAALIAACGSPFGLGSDAAGSVRLPAHFCGIAGLKPTSGRLPRTGNVPPVGGWIEMLWQIGPLARRVEDLWTLMPILLGPDGVDHTCVGMPYASPKIDGVRVAFFESNGIADPTAETAQAMREAARALAEGGIAVREQRPPLVEQSQELEMKLLGAQGGDTVRECLKWAGSAEAHPLLEAWISKIEPYRTTLEGFAGYWAELDRFRAAMFAFLGEYDAILSPVCATPALPHGASIDDRHFRGFSYTMTHNLTGWPAAVVRCGRSAEGLPIGVQIAARPWREDIALAVARRLEDALGGWERPYGL
jgi:amidase